MCVLKKCECLVSNVNDTFDYATVSVKRTFCLRDSLSGAYFLFTRQSQWSVLSVYETISVKGTFCLRDNLSEGYFLISRQSQ